MNPPTFVEAIWLKYNRPSTHPVRRVKEHRHEHIDSASAQRALGSG